MATQNPDQQARVTSLRVEQQPDGEKLFVLDDIRFPVLPIDDVLYAQPPGSIPVMSLRVFRADDVIEGHAELHSPHLQGGGYYALSIFGVMHVGSINASAFEDDDTICFDTPGLDLRSHIVEHWYIVKSQESPWREEDETATNAYVDATNALYGRLEAGEIDQQTYDQEAAVINERSEAQIKESCERLRREVPLPAILRFA